MKSHLVALAVLPLAFASAQTLAPNAAGVAMGHYHIRSQDVDAQRKLWIDVLRGQPAKLGPMEVAKLPGVIILYEKGARGGPMEGSVVNHIGFHVKSLKETLARAREAGFAIEGETTNGAYILGPDALRVEVSADPKLATESAHHHVHYSLTNVEETRTWYVKLFGATPGRRANSEAADVPGANLTFTPPASGTPAGTKGRSLDHIGFEVKDLEAFTKKLEAAGVKFDVPYRRVPGINVAIAYLTDPAGTYVELTEGLNQL